MFPGSEVSTIVRAVNEIQDLSTAIGLIGLGAPALGIARPVRGTRVGVQHRLRKAQPPVPSRQGDGRRADDRLLIVLFAGLIVASFGQSQLSQHAPGVAGNSVTAFLLSLAASSGGLRVPLRHVLPADERPAHAAGCPAGRARGHGCARADLPGAAAVSRPRPGLTRPAGLRRPGHPPRLALRHGERHRPGGRAQLVDQRPEISRFPGGGGALREPQLAASLRPEI